MRKYLLTLFIVVIGIIDAKSQKIDSIVTLYGSIGIHIEVPMGFAAKESFDEWADLRLERDSTELLYKTMDVPYHDMSKDPSKFSSFYWAMSMATIKNISVNEHPKIQPLPQEGVSKDFNANLGFICLFTPRSTFSSYKHGVFLGLHKPGHQDVAVLLMGNNLENLKNSISSLIIGKIKYN